MSAPSLRICRDEAEAAEAVAQVVAELIEAGVSAGRPPVLGLATGRSPRGVYAALVRRHAEGRLSFAGVRAFALDEYVPIAPDDARSFAATLYRELTGPVGMDPGALRVPDGRRGGSAARAEALAHELALAAAGGIDLQILGIGRNGHLGFNEPGAAFDGATALVDLAESTRADAAAAFGGLEQVPPQAISMGLGTILRARRIELLAFGEAKAEAVARALAGPLDPAWPASVLRRHPRVTVWLDAAAASRLPDVSG